MKNTLPIDHQLEGVYLQNIDHLDVVVCRGHHRDRQSEEVSEVIPMDGLKLLQLFGASLEVATETVQQFEQVGILFLSFLRAGILTIYILLRIELT